MKITSMLMDPRVQEAFASYHDADFRAMVFSDPNITDTDASYWSDMFVLHGFSRSVRMLLAHRANRGVEDE